MAIETARSGRRSSSERAGDLIGAFLDLDMVARACDRLLTRNTQNDPTALDRTTLWTAAVVLYARCFVSGARTPLSGQVLRTMTAAERKVHDRTMEERHRYIAHVELAREEILTVGRVIRGGMGRVGHQVQLRRLTHHPEHARELRDLAKELCLVLSRMIDEELAKLPMTKERLDIEAMG